MDKMVWTKWYWTKWYWTKWYGQIGMEKMVYGQNGIRQNATDKMVWTKWYTDKMALDKMIFEKMVLGKMVWTKWYGQNGTDKILRIKSSKKPAPDNMIFSSIPLPV